MSFINKIRLILLLIYKTIIEYSTHLLNIRRKCKSKRKLNGKVVVITGANTGIGKETAYQLSLLGAKVIIGCRDVKKGENAINDIKDRNPNTNITLLKLDLSSLASVRQFAKEVAQRVTNIDILINNAGVCMCDESQTEDGFEMHFGTNHLGHFLLTLLLLNLLKKSKNARILNISSFIQNFGSIHINNINLKNIYTPTKGYSQSKLANVLFTRELAKRLGKNSSINVYALHPGIINTEISRHMGFWLVLEPVAKLLLFISVESGTQTTLYCALEESLDNESGFYYDNCRRVYTMLPHAIDDIIAQQLWDMSCDLAKLEEHLKF